ncbi:glutamate-rich protein 5 [Marmota monax]|uniref:Glutamate-rich protein 5 n=1 Tax=Marmota monax TaxID=9995 RepID=A0A834QBV3_MARMO|nr:glutamate-rich protein 5 [Marmota monax]
MGCSSSALNKAGDNSKFRSVTSNECLSTTEESESCVAQPTPRTPGKESIFHGNIQRESLPPLEKPKASVVPTANGVVSCERPLAKEVAPEKDAIDQIGPTEKTQPLQGPAESEAPHLGGRDDTPGAKEKKKDVETMTEVQAVKGNSQTELSEVKDPSSGTAGERNSSGTREDAENPPTVAVMQPPGTMENIQPLETDGELQPPEATGKDEQSQFLEAIPKENKSPEMLEGSQFVETNEEQKFQETVGNEEQSQLLETISKENLTSEILYRSQSVQTPVMNDLLHTTSDGPENMEQIQPERIVGSVEQPEGIPETAANVEMAGKIHTNQADQHTEGETGEKVETEMENENVSERAETKEEETGEAVDLSAATELGMATEW